MIDVKELRVGNYLSIHGSPAPIQIGWFYLIAKKEELPPHEPIELTPEILKRCGFKKYDDREPDDDCCLYLDDSVVSIKIDASPTGYQEDDFILNKFGSNFSFPEMSFELWSETDPTEVKDRSMCIQFKNIQYLHQLQNLYFAITGEELKIEL